MSKADEMFEKLGYKKYGPEYNLVCYYVRYTPEGEKEEICFNGKTFAAFIEGHYSYIYCNELKAITQKCKELGWLNE